MQLYTYMSFRSQLQESGKAPLECYAGSYIQERDCAPDKGLLAFSKENTNVGKNVKQKNSPKQTYKWSSSTLKRVSISLITEMQIEMTFRYLLRHTVEDGYIGNNKRWQSWPQTGSLGHCCQGCRLELLLWCWFLKKWMKQNYTQANAYPWNLPL